MHGHFKSKRTKKIFIFMKICLFLLIVYVSFSFFYRLLFKKYISNISHEELINKIIYDSKLNYDKGNMLDKYLTLEYILKYTLDLDVITKDEVVLDVIKEVPIVDNPKVYIYSTHENEAYNDKVLESYNIVPNVKTTQYILADYLNDYNIETILEDRSVNEVLKSNNWSYSKSYDASRILINDVINNNDFKLIIDLHRDSGSRDSTTLEYNGKNYAKVLFIVGGENINYESNYNVASKLNDILNSSIEGISRGVKVKNGIGVNGIYNQDLNNNMILIELGGQYNEIEELNNSIETLSLSILKYLEGE